MQRKSFEYTSEIGKAGQAYLDQFEHAHPLPGQFRWSELWQAMLDAAKREYSPIDHLGQEQK